MSRRFRLWLLSSSPADWATPYLAGQTFVDALDVDAAIAAVRTLRETRPLAGILCYDELRIVAGATIAEALGLPTTSARSVLACRDKRLSRQLMTEAGDLGPQSIGVTDLAGAQRAAERIGYPVVLKPRALAGSEGVAKVDGPGQLVERFAFTKAAHFDDVPRFDEDVLVEEYLDGPEIAIDSVVWKGEVRPVFVSHKQFDLAPTFEETGHVISAEDPLLRDRELTELVRAAHSALGFDHGVTHTEVRLTRHGPRIVEVNGRLGGDLIPYVGLLATGIDLALAAADLAARRMPDLRPRRARTAAVRFYYPARDLVVERVRVDPAGLPPHISEVRPLAGQGDTLLRPPGAFVFGRAAAGFAVADDQDTCRRALDGLADTIEIAGHPVPEKQPI
ncbi:ATP-grasp domain-containing protein [Solihabitans fulvus]|uniref:ATP-grasp domain-containing protein n=1 Tax=Solihabitans fulvus TaxID=1892852 RepID=UPI00166194C6|nr:ATP-grasp domain-containing protein [Solihabitans fulvus]